MEQLAWVFFGVFALALSVGAVGVRSVPKYVAQLAAGASVFVWGYWAISATSVQIAANGTEQSYTGAMYLGLAFAAIMLLLLVESIFEMFGLGDTNA